MPLTQRIGGPAKIPLAALTLAGGLATVAPAIVVAGPIASSPW
ncbi:hypothetical protein ACWEGE_09565 [Amycolatopsis sp. NPDC004747]